MTQQYRQISASERQNFREAGQLRRGPAPKVKLESKKMTDPVYYLVLILALLKDALDLLLNITLILSIVVMPITVVLELLVVVYLIAAGVNLSTRKVALWAVTACMESMPIFSIFPTFTCAIIYTKHLENKAIKKRNKQKKRVARRARQQMVRRTA